MPDRRDRVAWIRRRLEHRHLPIHLAIVAFLVCAPSLWSGFALDDHVIRMFLADPPIHEDWTGSPLKTFAFFPGDSEFQERTKYTGGLPWWVSDDFRIAFFRPLSGITHWVDLRLWPDTPFLMHLQSLLWLAAAIAAATVLYRRFLGMTWIAGLAALMFAMDDGHAMPAMWIANRSAVISVGFGLAALIAHDSWRRNGSRAGAIMAPASLAIGLLASEMAVATGAYILGYALFLDRDSPPRRLASLVPCASVGIVWWLVYTSMGYGTAGSSLYIDPSSSPLRFFGAVIERAPLLIKGLWSFPSDMHNLLSPDAARAMWWVAIAWVLVFLMFLIPLLRRDTTARFFAFSTAIATLPACATFPSDRLMFFAAFGALGLLAQLMAGVFRWDGWTPSSGWWRKPARVFAVVLLIGHIPAAPFSMLRTLSSGMILERIIDRSVESFPSDPEVEGRWIMIVNSPAAYLSGLATVVNGLEGKPMAERGLIMGSSIEPIHVRRTGPQTLVVSPEGGFLERGGASRADRETTPRPFDPRYMLGTFDRLFRDTPMAAGEKIEVGDVLITVLTVTADGRPSDVEFRLPTELEDPRYRWMKWLDGGYSPFPLPAIGESVVLPAAEVKFFDFG